MEITIGIQNLAREITVTTDATAAELSALVEEALAGKSSLTLTDIRGRQIIIPSASIGFVELGADSPRHVGFGAV